MNSGGRFEAVESADLVYGRVMALPGLPRPHMASLLGNYPLRRSALEVMEGYNVGSRIKVVSGAVQARLGKAIRSMQGADHSCAVRWHALNW